MTLTLTLTVPDDVVTAVKDEIEDAIDNVIADEDLDDDDIIAVWGEAPDDDGS